MNVHVGGTGKAGVGETTKISVAGKFHRLSDPSAPAAILISDRTASSGEAVALALARDEGTRRFGETTAGAATANASVPLSDGSYLNLTIAEMEDRSGNRFPDGIPPDVKTSPDRILDRASEWLGQRYSCSQ